MEGQGAEANLDDVTYVVYIPKLMCNVYCIEFHVFNKVARQRSGEVMRVCR